MEGYSTVYIGPDFERFKKSREIHREDVGVFSRIDVTNNDLVVVLSETGERFSIMDLIKYKRASVVRKSLHDVSSTFIPDDIINIINDFDVLIK